jgi:predicted O-linked N-acetylglucosamine transferase (SPINDLY family)
MTPDRRLRIGWISPRFSEGPVASFLKDTLSAFDRQQFEHILVSLGTAKDAHTAEFRRLSSEWVDAQALDDQALLGLLRSMNLDIAIDLAGHSFGNRLRVLAQRVAPLQICWLDYFNTTGVSSIDAWISDEWLTPLDSTQRYVESVYRLHSGRFCYSPSAEAPEPTRMLGGEPVFVSFNRLAKLNDKVIDTWSEILRRVPGSRLDLGASTLVDSIARTRVVERFAERDIKAERLGLYGTRNYTDLLEAYRQADIALDPFPFSGCTTTADALWMGLPVVTFPGNTFVSRQSASLLHRLKRPNWVASSVDEYVDCAATLAEMVDQLRKSRNSLREDVRRSICNSESQAREMAGLFRELWLKYSSLSTRN